MIPVLVPTTDVNSETGTVTRWIASDRAPVAKGDPVAEVETSKAILEVEAPADGLLLHGAPAGATVPLDRPVAHVFDGAAALEAFVASRAAEASAVALGGDDEGPRASAPARRRAAELGVDLRSIGKQGLISVRDVEAAHDARRRAADAAARPFLPPLAVPAGVLRVLLIGGGAAATQVIEILRHATDRAAVGIVDDTPEKRGTDVCGVPVIGTTDRIAELHRAGAFDAAVCAFGVPVEARTRFREVCAAAGVPLASAIAPTATIASDAQVGAGNVLCAFVHVANGCVLGENNFVSAYNSFDHHTRVGSDGSTGPGCMTSGNVTLGDRVRLGTGIFVEPGVRIGSDVQVASGAVIVRDVPDGHAVKTKVVTTAVVPRHPPRPAAGGGSA